MDKYLIAFIIATVIIISAIAIYPQFVSMKQDDIIAKLDALQENRTRQFVALIKTQLENQHIGLVNQNLTLENQKLIKTNQELIKNVTGTNLNLTIHNRAMLDDSNDRLRVIDAILGLNDTKKAMQILNLTHNDTQMVAIWKANKLSK